MCRLRLSGGSARPAVRVGVLFAAVLAGVLAPAAGSSEPAAAQTQAGGPGSAVTVLTWNIHTEDPGDLAETIAASGASVVALQEVDAHQDRSGCVDQAAEIAARLGMTAVFGANLQSRPECKGPEPALHGDAILTRHPIVEWRHVLLPNGGGEQRGFVEAVLDVDGRRIRVVSTHFEFRSGSERKEQAEALVAHVGAPAEPLVVMGDLNGDPSDPPLRPMRDRFIDAWEVAGSGDGHTHSRPNPSRRIDYVYLGSGVTAEAADVIEGVSDHLAVRARLAF